MNKPTILPLTQLGLQMPLRLRQPTSNESDSTDPIIIPIDRIDFRLARGRRDLVGAFGLLQRRYADAGLAADASKQLRVLPYHLWPETQMFVAEYSGSIIASISLTRDGNTQGMPMESTYPDVIERLRRSGQSFGEVGSLTVDSPASHSTGEMFGQMTRLMMFYARRNGLDHLIAVVHPRHAKFYQRAMGFETVGEPTEYNQVGGQLGIPIMGSVNDRSRYRRRWQKFYFEGEFHDRDLEPSPVQGADLLFFQSFLPSSSQQIPRRNVG